MIRWDKGSPEFISPDGDFSFRPKGRLLMDASTTSGSRFDQRNITGTEVRALRLGVEGTMGRRLGYTLEVDFADNNPLVRGAYLVWKDRWQGTDVEITLGNRLSERTIEGSSSSDATPFMERNATASAITPLKGFYGLGVLAKAYGPDWHIAAQVAGEDVNNPGDGRDSLTYMLRGHWNPVKTKTAAIHLGAWSFYEDFAPSVTSVSRNSYWAGHFNDNLQVALGALPGPRDGVGYGVELGGVRGPGWAFLEAGRRRINTASDHVDVEAIAISAGWVLTGEAPAYTARGGTFSKARLLEPVSKGGAGSWEIAARYQLLDNTDAPVGGKGEEVTLGVNWRLEEWVRVMLNLSHWEVEQRTGPFLGSDSGNSLAGRMQISF